MLSLCENPHSLQITQDGSILIYSVPDFSSEDVVIQFDEPRELRKATGDSVGINLIRLNDQKFIVHDSLKVEIWELPAHDAEHRHSGDIADFLDVNTQLSSKVVYEHTFGFQKSPSGKEGNYHNTQTTSHVVAWVRTRPHAHCRPYLGKAHT